MPKARFSSLEKGITTGDKWIAKAGLRRVDYVKIDVEGFEDEVLLGLRETIRPVLEPSSANSAGKIRFYLKHALNPEILPVIEPPNRYYPYLIAVPTARKDRFDLS